MTGERAMEIDGEVLALVAEATVFGLESPYPRPEEALERVYAPF